MSRRRRLGGGSRYCPRQAAPSRRAPLAFCTHKAPTMELTLERSDLCQVGTISHLNTLALTEDKKSGRLRIVIGDDNGRPGL